MSTASPTLGEAPSVDPRTRRNVAALFCAQAIGGAQQPINITFAPLIGAQLAPTAQLATLPITTMVLATMLASPLASAYMSRVGRRVGFWSGTVFGACGGALALYACLASSFWMFLLSTALIGCYTAFQNFFRFAATDTAPDFFKPKAVSYVLAGGLIAAVLGGILSRGSQDLLLPIPLAGAYLAVIAVNIAAMIPIAFVDIPRPQRLTANERPQRGEPGSVRGLGEIFSTADARIALLVGMISYSLMTLMMTATSTAMIGCGYGAGDAATVISAHVIAMFGPSFFTGSLIARFGHLPIMMIGLAMLATAAVAAATGIDLMHFYGALILLGVGWNFGFIGASSLLAKSHRPEERAKVQGFNDFCVFGLVALASLASGQLYFSVGWVTLTLAMLPILAATVVLVAGMARVKL
ncbi:MAG: MFS transporter [Neomegalonema sp.]|nr:MFS transporter [Neomegalonema sp.]